MNARESKTPGSAAMNRALDRVSHRELHRSRSIATVSVSILLIVCCVWLLAEWVLELFWGQSILISPRELAALVPALWGVETWMIVGICLGVTLIGVVLVFLALSPGHRARHRIHATSVQAIVDDEVVASSLARVAAGAANVDRNQTSVSVSRKKATVALTPSSGYPVDRGVVREQVEAHLDRLDLQPTLNVRVLPIRRGKVGA